MKLLDAASNIQKSHPEDKLKDLMTPFGEKVTDTPLLEYPRPQFVRDNYTSLNGIWKICFDKSEVAPIGDDLIEESEILVPFSPESNLSHVKRTLLPGERLWYKKIINFSKEDKELLDSGYRCILHFGAVDYKAVLFVNDEKVLSHEGGYIPFAADITEYLKYKNDCIKLMVTDDTDTTAQGRGKQKLERGGMFYTAQSGIWQSVWYEIVPENFMDEFIISPNPDDDTVTVSFTVKNDFKLMDVRMEEDFLDKFLLCEVKKGKNKTAYTIIMNLKKGYTLWTPDTPKLYNFTLYLDDDVVKSYFAMRCVSIEKDEKNISRFCLNHKPLFLHGILDQGYYPDGLMTAPTDEAMIYDIELVKKLGFNMIRKHLKVEPLRWYYHCDRLGMIVWQDMVNGGDDYIMPFVSHMPTLFPKWANKVKDNHYSYFGRTDAGFKLQWYNEMKQEIRHLASTPCIAVWVPFNEGWGQFDANRITDAIKKEDPTRLVDQASGWFDQKGGDFRSVHNYFRKLSVEDGGERAFVISEYGGYAFHIKDHAQVDRIYGYRKYNSKEDLNKAFWNLIDNELKPLIDKGLSGAVYTQLSDVEEEVNGIVTYDRRIVKIDCKK